jgi:hypothetical protein
MRESPPLSLSSEDPLSLSPLAEYNHHHHHIVVIYAVVETQHDPSVICGRFFLFVYKNTLV